MEPRRIRTALISVYDKTGIVDFARALVNEFGIEIISTGGTAKLLKENGLPVTLVEEITGFPELLDGRVKTLHPKIFAGILADRGNPEHMRQLEQHGIMPIDMVVVNLYPFSKTVEDPNCTFEQAIEMIDIGGVALLRAAAKNHKHVLAICGTVDKSYAIDLLSGKEVAGSQNARQRFAAISFAETTWLDSGIESYLWCKLFGNDWKNFEQLFPPILLLELTKRSTSRYGENPHQRASLYRTENDESFLRSVGNRTKQAFTFNNSIDSEAARNLCIEIATELAKCGTGFQPVNENTANVQSVNEEHSHSSSDAGFAKIDSEQHFRRHLPHIQNPGKTYFVTFRLREKGALSPQERTVVLDACRFWDGNKIDLHACVVMRDHVHLLLTPLKISNGQWPSLGELVHSIKRYSAQTINKLRQTQGSIWLDEYFDRIMRNEKEFFETLNYIADNPVKEGLAPTFEEYPWFWDESRRSKERDSIAGPSVSRCLEADGEEPSQSKVGSTLIDRLETGPTCPVRPTHWVCTFIKHTNPCGVGIAEDSLNAYRKAYQGDPLAAMGGTLACSFEITPDFAKSVMGTLDQWGRERGAGGFFVENWIATGFPLDARRVIEESKEWGKRVRFFVHRGSALYHPGSREFRSILGGMLVQTTDNVGLNESDWKIVTKRKPSDAELADLRLAWLIAKHTKSNAISICKDGMLIGNGAGQMSRVMSCRIATWLAKENGHEAKLPGSAAASDGFFPFDDGPKLLMDAGVTAIIQPGGSKRDEEVIRACDERDVSMIFTGIRHFKH